VVRSLQTGLGSAQAVIVVNNAATKKIARDWNVVMLFPCLSLQKK